GGRGGAGRGGPVVPAGPTPKLANGKPDLSGHWTNPYTPFMSQNAVDPMTRQPLTFARKGEAFPANTPKDGRGQAKTFDLPYTEWGMQAWKDYDAVANGDYAGSCLPFGMSRNIN